MRSFLFFFAFLAVLATTVFAWEKEDYEIFDLVSDLEASEGKGTTFYSWLDVLPTASTAEIAKAYRKKSLQLHPDKNPGIKGVHERFARLGVIASILRDGQKRERYDFFYKNGVPKWRGTGYYYSRFRPGLGTVLVFLTILTSSLQYVVQKLNYNRDIERIERFIREARIAAWGPKMTPLEGQRKVKVKIGDQHDEDGFISEKFINMVVDGEHVYILDPSGDMHPLNTSSATKPAISDTWFLALLGAVLRRIRNPSPKRSSDTPDNSSENLADDTGDDDQSSATGSDLTVTSKEDGKGQRAPAVKAGGRRRKAPKRR